MQSPPTYLSSFHCLLRHAVELRASMLQPRNQVGSDWKSIVQSQSVSTVTFVRVLKQSPDGDCVQCLRFKVVNYRMTFAIHSLTPEGPKSADVPDRLPRIAWPPCHVVALVLSAGVEMSNLRSQTMWRARYRPLNSNAVAISFYRKEFPVQTCTFWIPDGGRLEATSLPFLWQCLRTETGNF